MTGAAEMHLADDNSLKAIPRERQTDRYEGKASPIEP